MNKYSISTKLNIFVAIGLLFLNMVVTIFVYYSLKDTLLNTQFEKLTAIKTLKKEELTAYLKTLEGLLISLSNNKITKDSFSTFEDSFYKIQKETNSTNEIKEKLKSDSSYMNTYKIYHDSFDKILSNFSLSDIFLVDLKGNLIYTDFKEKDFTKNLKDNSYLNTSLAEAYNTPKCQDNFF